MKTLVLICAFREAEPWEQPSPGANSGICEILTEGYSGVFEEFKKKKPLFETWPALK